MHAEGGEGKWTLTGGEEGMEVVAGEVRKEWVAVGNCGLSGSPSRWDASRER